MKNLEEKITKILDDRKPGAPLLENQVKAILSLIKEHEESVIGEIKEWIEKHTRDFDGVINLDNILDKKEILEYLKKQHD